MNLIVFFDSQDNNDIIIQIIKFQEKVNRGYL